MVYLIFYLILIGVLDFLLSVEYFFKVDVWEGVVLGAREVGHFLLNLNKSHNLFKFIKFDAAPFFVEVVEDLIEDFKNSLSDVWM